MCTRGRGTSNNFLSMHCFHSHEMSVFVPSQNAAMLAFTGELNVARVLHFSASSFTRLKSLLIMPRYMYVV